MKQCVRRVWSSQLNREQIRSRLRRTKGNIVELVLQLGLNDHIYPRGSIANTYQYLLKSKRRTQCTQDLDREHVVFS